MSNNSCPECLQYRKGEFCQVCYKRAKDDLLKQAALNKKNVEMIFDAHKDIVRTILDEIDRITDAHTLMDVSFKVREHTLSVRRRLGLPPKAL